MAKRNITSSSSSTSRERSSKAQNRRDSVSNKGGKNDTTTNDNNKGFSLSLQLPPLHPHSSSTSSSTRSSTPSSGSNCSSHRSAHNDDCHLSPHNNNNNYNNKKKMSGGEKCVCFICTCGKHHCPPAYKPSSTPLDACTHYSETYKAHNTLGDGCYPARVVVSQQYVGTRAAPGHFDTTHKANYVAPDNTHTQQANAERMERSRPSHNNNRTSPNSRESVIGGGMLGERDTFTHTSVQRNDYPWHTPSPTAPIRPSAETPVSAGPFCGNSTTKDTYVGWKPDPDAFQRSSHSNRNNHNHSTSHTPFSSDKVEFSTSYANTFVEHTLSHRTPPHTTKPKTTYTYGSPRFFETSNQSDFTGKQNPVCPAHALPARPPSARTGHIKYTLDTTGTWA